MSPSIGTLLTGLFNSMQAWKADVKTNMMMIDQLNNPIAAFSLINLLFFPLQL